MAGRTIVLGDIHGCSDALASLLHALAPERSDRVIVLGDYIDRGPDSQGAIEQLLELARRTWLIPILGNHDRMLLSLLGGRAYMTSNWMALGGGATLRSFGVAAPELIPERYVGFLRSCREAYETPMHLFVHANYLPSVPLDQQPSYVLRWESLKVRMPGPHYSGKQAIVGHTAQRSGQILDLGHLKCIDTCCYGGGWLTALHLETGELLQADLRGRLRTGRPKRLGCEA
jgi:serine/threonine protein phosphatase 1